MFRSSRPKKKPFHSPFEFYRRVTSPAAASWSVESIAARDTYSWVSRWKILKVLIIVELFDYCAVIRSLCRACVYYLIFLWRQTEVLLERVVCLYFTFVRSYLNLVNSFSRTLTGLIFVNIRFVFRSRWSLSVRPLLQPHSLEMSPSLRLTLLSLRSVEACD